MRLPQNRFKRALSEGRQQIGLWNCMPGSMIAELVATAGFDWVVIDTEHSPTDVPDILPMLQAMAPYRTAAVVRPAANDPVLIKQILDFGAQTLILPFIETADEARAAVAAIRYAPRGIRGVAGITRATQFGLIHDYHRQAETELCLILQVETAAALSRIPEIAAVDGVDALFIGPADLAASLGHAGNMHHPEVLTAIERAIVAIRAAGKPAGILVTDPALAERCMAWGTSFTAVGTDTGLLADATRALAARFRAPE